MAKEDFCFTFYDGDAARDMAHMNRLERGGYSDLIISQRKFGHLSLARIKKTLGSDFDLIWESLEVVLKKDGAGNYYIEWLSNSIEKMRRQSIHQSNNGSKGGRPKKTQQEPFKNPTDNPNKTQTITQEKPLGNGDGNEIGDGKGSVNGDEKYLVPQMCKRWYDIFPSYTADSPNDYMGMGSMLQFILRQANVTDFSTADNQEKILNTVTLIAERVIEEPFWAKKPIKSIANHIQEFYNKIKNPVHAKESKTDRLKDIRGEATAERNRRRAEREQAANQSGA